MRCAALAHAVFPLIHGIMIKTKKGPAGSTHENCWRPKEPGNGIRPRGPASHGVLDAESIEEGLGRGQARKEEDELHRARTNRPNAITKKRRSRLLDYTVMTFLMNEASRNDRGDRSQIGFVNSARLQVQVPASWFHVPAALALLASYPIPPHRVYREAKAFSSLQLFCLNTHQLDLIISTNFLNCHIRESARRNVRDAHQLLHHL